MLLLTDDLEKGGELQRVFATSGPCEMLALDAALERPATHDVIACDAALDPATASKLQAALAHHRADHRTPVLFLTRDSSLYTEMQATALGSTKTLPRDTPGDVLVCVLGGLASATDGAGRTARPATGVPDNGSQRDVQEIGTALWSVLEAARQRQAIPIAALDRGADALLVSIRKTRIKPWLELVRRYDDVTFQHCLLVAGLVAGFACRLGLAAPNQRLLAQAALVHDIGKAIVPRHILNKAGPLSPTEMTLMRTHPAAGYDMLARQRGIGAPMLGIVRHHHEYIDGSGYPDGLRGAQISDLVRLVTICDIFAALIERRSYKPPMPARQACAILLEMNGKLDASLLKAFESYVKDM